ncbi:MAG TPA: MFS transporter, partial [Chitinophagaceae bacterium]|nr:MFS transporter [Chitinophagaceae bacterium]
AMIFGLKVGLSIGGAVSAWLLGIFHYQGDAPTQPASAVNGIRLLETLVPGLIFIGAALLLFGYAINKQSEQQIEHDLKERRKLLSI